MYNFNRKTLIKFTTTIQNFCISPDDACDDLPPPPPPPPPPENHTLSPLIILMICTFASCFTFVCYITIIKIYSAFRNRSRARNTHNNTNDRTQNEIHNEHFINENHDVVFHPIWLINTIGLDQSVIDSIEVFKYRKKHGSDFKDCAVCLGEFQDDETLRILPKCSHAFHVTCIDTWLRSHVNCPLCRAPIVIVNDNNNDNDNTSISIHDQVDDNSNTDDEEIIIPVDHDLGNDVMQDENKQNDEKKYLCNGVRVQSDLRDYYCCDQKFESMRRSISMDSFSASMVRVDDQGSRELVVLKNTNVVERSGKRKGLSSSISRNSTHRAMKSSSFGVRSGKNFKYQSL